jgi:hypothetical protein
LPAETGRPRNPSAAAACDTRERRRARWALQCSLRLLALCARLLSPHRPPLIGCANLCHVPLFCGRGDSPHRFLRGENKKLARFTFCVVTPTARHCKDSTGRRGSHRPRRRCPNGALSRLVSPFACVPAGGEALRPVRLVFCASPACEQADLPPAASLRLTSMKRAAGRRTSWSPPRVHQEPVDGWFLRAWACRRAPCWARRGGRLR